MSSGPTRPVIHTRPASSVRAVRSAAWVTATPVGTSTPAPRASSTARPGNGTSANPNIAQCASSDDGARPQPKGRCQPDAPRAASASRTGVSRGLGRRATAELGHRAVAQPVEDDEHHGQPVVVEARLGLAVPGRPHGRVPRSSRSTGTVDGSTIASHVPSAKPSRIAAASSLVAGSPSTTVTA